MGLITVTVTDYGDNNRNPSDAASSETACTGSRYKSVTVTVIACHRNCLSYGSPYAPAINRYDEYGTPQAGNVGRFQYTGQVWLGELSAYYYKARIYSPTFGGRFLQTDPVGYAGGINLYAYVGNDPVNWVDPLGLKGLGVCQEINIPGPTGEEVGTNVWICDYDTNRDNLWTIVGDRVSWRVERPERGALLTPTETNPESTKNGCLLPADDQFFENALQVAGIVGDGLAIAGALTGNPVLALVGVSLSYGSTALSASLNISQGDMAGLGGDFTGAVAGLAPGGRLMRHFGGAVLDAGRSSSGRFVSNWAGKQGAQDIATEGLQERAGGAAAEAIGRVVQCPR